MRVVAALDFPGLRERLAREISAARSRDPLAAVTVVVPNELARAATRTDLARRLDGTIGTEVTSLPRWVDESAGRVIARAGGRRLTEAGFERLVARVLEERSRKRGAGPLAASAAPGTARLLASTLADLYEGGFDPQSDEIAAAVEADPLRRELPILFRELDDAMRHERLFDRRRAERTALQLAREGDVTAATSPLLAFGFHDPTPVQRELILATSRRRDVTIFAPGLGAGESRAGEAALEPLLSWAKELAAGVELVERGSDALVTLEHDLFRAPAIRDPGAAHLELSAYATESAEARGIAGRILEEVHENGRSFDDFLVTVPSRGGPSPLFLRRIFAKAEIPLHDGIGVRSSRTDGGRRALALARAAGAQRDAREIEALDFLAPLERAAEDAPAATEAFVRSRDAAEACARFRDVHASRFGVPPTEEVEDALDALALVLGSRPLRPRDFAAALAAALETTLVRSVGEARGVLLLGMDAARGVSRPFAFHAGLVRGAVRRSAGEDPLLPDDIRRKLMDRFAHVGKRLKVAEDRTDERLLLARFALESATEHAVLSFAQRDRVGGEPRNPSGLLLDVASARHGRPLEASDAELQRLAPARSRERARRRPVDATDLDLAVLGGDLPPTEDDLVRVVGEARGRHLPSVLRAAQSRWGDAQAGPWDGALSDPRVVRRIAELVSTREWSPSALDALVNCPFSFLLKLLRLDHSDDTGDDFDPADKGNVFHELAEATYRELVLRKRLPLEPASLPEALAVLDEHVRRVDVGLGAEPALRRLHRRATLTLVRNDLALVLAREAHRSAPERTLPLRFELMFGREGDLPAPTFPLPGGDDLPLRGKLDRVDQRVDGSLEIVDFKTGSTRPKSGALRMSGSEKKEMRLQLPIYLQALPQVLGRPALRATYYFATSDQAFTEVVYTAADLERDRDEIGRVLAHAIARARQGWLPCTPGTKSCCYARNAAACGPSVAERFRRKLADPDMSEHLALVRGSAASDADAEETS